MSSLRLTTSLHQRMILTPQLRQRIEMLQMTSLELTELIEQELVANPVLEEVQSGDEIQEISDNILDQNADGHDEGYQNGADLESKSPVETSREFDPAGETFTAEKPSENGFDDDSTVDFETGDDSAQERSDSFEEIDYGREFQDYLDPGYRTQEIEYRDDAPSFEQFLSHTPTLSEHLEWQLTMMQISEKLEEAATGIIGNLDADGRLTASLEDVASLSQCSMETAEKAQQIVLNLEPVGCGARDVRECLLAQLEANGEGESLAADLVRNHLEDLQPHRLQHLAKDTGLDIHNLDARRGGKVNLRG